jgi:hypothetical protein
MMTTLPIFGLTLGLVPNIKPNKSLVVCMMTVGVRTIDTGRFMQRTEA